MRYEILQNDEVINVIIADEEFCTAYCAENGYTYREAPIADNNADDATDTEILNILLGGDE